MNFSIEVKEKLFSIIAQMNLYHWLFTKSPEKDFLRKKKWSFGEIMKFMLSMEGKSLKDELLEYFDFDNDTPSNSSFNQRRAQILPEAFEFLFHEFTNSFDSKNTTFNGFRLMACDGSDLCITHNKDDETTYIRTLPNGKGFNELHLNALYDLCTRKYIDALIQPAHQKNEKRAMCDLIDRYSGTKNTIFIADRGYENYNIFAHAQQKGMYYLIRVKDVSSNGIASHLDLPKTPEFDECVTTILTKKQTVEVRENPQKYKTIRKATSFDYLDLYSNKFYELHMRVVRLPVSENNYECIITNIPKNIFTSEQIKELYRMRWGIETSFRELKYAIGLTRFHSKKVEYIIQEIWARLTLYNFCEIITASVLVDENENRKYKYQLNYTRAIRICCHFISIKKGKAPPDIEFLISHELLPVRAGRSDPRKVRPQSVVSFLYRTA